MEQLSLFNLHPAQIIRCLWMNNPYASLMPLGKIETRTKPTAVRGKVLICSCKTPYSENKVMDISGVWQADRIFQVLKHNNVTELDGVAICLADLVDCRLMTEDDSDACFVKYDPNKKLYCWIFENVQKVIPFRIKGKQGWKLLRQDRPEELDIINQIKIAI